MSVSYESRGLASDRSLVQRSSTARGESACETSTMSRPVPEKGCCTTGKRNAYVGVGLEILRAVTEKRTSCWDITTFSMVKIYRDF
jgi:hypothetical protein